MRNSVWFSLVGENFATLLNLEYGNTHFFEWPESWMIYSLLLFFYFIYLFYLIILFNYFIYLFILFIYFIYYLFYLLFYLFIIYFNQLWL